MSGVTSAREVARRLGISHTAIQKAERAGRIAREPNGAWDIDKVRAGLETKGAPAPRKPYRQRAKQPPWARAAHHVGELASDIRAPARGIHAELERARQALERAARQMAALYPEILCLERACDAAIAAQVPTGALVLTAGVDVQDDRLECDVWGWAEGSSSWLVDHVVIQGSPRDREPWDDLAKLLARDWPRQGGGAMRIAKLCVDTGGRDTAAVYGHLRRLRDPRIAPSKGVDGWNRAQPVQGPTPVDAMVDGRKVRRGLKLWTISVSTWKADLYRRLWLGRGDAEQFPPGWVHLPQGIEAEWVKQLVAEQLRTVKDRRDFARQEWAKLRERNEALDCAVLARAALWLLGADRYGERFWAQLREQVANAPLQPSEVPTGGHGAPPPPPPPPAASDAHRPRGWLAPRHGWLR